MRFTFARRLIYITATCTGDLVDRSVTGVVCFSFFTGWRRVVMRKIVLAVATLMFAIAISGCGEEPKKSTSSSAQTSASTSATTSAGTGTAASTSTTTDKK